MPIDLSGYVEVKDRIAEFKEKYPDGRLRSRIVESGHAGYIAVLAEAYRTADDPAPGSGLAWEPVPGKTPYTKDSELQNAETSAWGRAIVAALIADASQGVASANEVRNRQEPSANTPIAEGYVCPSCGTAVQNNLQDHFADNKKPAFRCGNKACQGGGKKKTGGGNWPWATWDADFFRNTTDEFKDELGDPILEQFPLAEYEPDDSERPF